MSLAARSTIELDDVQCSGLLALAQVFDGLKLLHGCFDKIKPPAVGISPTPQKQWKTEEATERDRERERETGWIQGDSIHREKTCADFAADSESCRLLSKEPQPRTDEKAGRSL